MKNHSSGGSFYKLITTVVLMAGVLISIPAHAGEKCDSLHYSAVYFQNIFDEMWSNCMVTGDDFNVCYTVTAVWRNEAQRATAEYLACRD